MNQLNKKSKKKKKKKGFSLKEELISLSQKGILVDRKDHNIEKLKFSLFFLKKSNSNNFNYFNYLIILKKMSK